MLNHDDVINGDTGEFEKPADFGTGLRVIDPLSMPDLDSAEVGISIDPQYWKPEKGEVIRAIFNGFSYHMKRDPEGMKRVDTAVFQTKNGFLMQSGVALMERLKTITPGTPVQVTYLGKVKSGGGHEVSSFDIKLLRVNRPSLPASPPPPAAPAIPATVPAADPDSDPGKRKVTPRTPLAPETLREMLGRKVAIYTAKKVFVSQADRGLVAVKLTDIFGGDKEKRHVLTAWLVGEAEVKKMNQAQVKALLDWIGVHEFDGVPSAEVKQEAESAYFVALQSQPKES